jgi:hypothetical protein
MNEKNTILTPFDVTNKMLGPYMFSHTARETLGDKIELYFHDHSFVPLFIQVGSEPRPWVATSRIITYRRTTSRPTPQKQEILMVHRKH